MPSPRFRVRLKSIAAALLPALMWGGPPSSMAADLTARQVTETLFKARRGDPIDFSGKDLRSLDLSGLDFKGARLASADLMGADLTDANLTGVDLSGARLDRATVIRADFSRANLKGATLLGPTVFSSLNIDQTDAPRFVGGDLRGIRIAARLDGGDFRDADLTGAVIGRQSAVWGSFKPRAAMHGANFSGAKLVGADLYATDLVFARFVGADLTRANLAYADLSRADLTGADLAGANLTDVDLDGAILTGAKGLETTVGFASVRNLDKAVR